MISLTAGQGFTQACPDDRPGSNRRGSAASRRRADLGPVCGRLTTDRRRRNVRNCTIELTQARQPRHVSEMHSLTAALVSRSRAATASHGLGRFSGHCRCTCHRCTAAARYRGRRHRRCVVNQPMIHGAGWHGRRLASFVPCSVAPLVMTDRTPSTGFI